MNHVLDFLVRIGEARWRAVCTCGAIMPTASKAATQAALEQHGQQVAA